MPSFRMRKYCVLRSRSRRSVTPPRPLISQPDASQARRMWARSDCASVSVTSGGDPFVAARASAVLARGTDARPRASLTASAGPRARMSARPITFSGSRTLPGQS